jgi:alkylation response protein AidB-like acyl-CoA dehydrogenase
MRGSHFVTDVLAAIRELTPEIRARARNIEQARRMPADLARSLAASGLFRMAVPRDAGGLELEPAALLRAVEAAGAADASVGWCVMIGATSGVTAAYLPTPIAREIFGPADSIVGGVFAPMGRAEIDGDGFVLSGRWAWASGSANCRWLIGGCLVTKNGELLKLPNGMPDERRLIFPAEAATLNDTWHSSGLCGTGSGEMVVSSLPVPGERAVSYDKPVATGPLYAFPFFGLLALGIGAVALGNARGAIEDLVELAGGKQPLGSRRTLAERGSAQSTLAIAEANLRAARAFFYEVVDEAWQLARQSGAIQMRHRASLRLAATHATRTAADVTRSMYDLGGGSSVFMASPLQRRFRDSHVATQHIMVAPPTYELTGRIFMGLPVEPTAPM